MKRALTILLFALAVSAFGQTPTPTKTPIPTPFDYAVYWCKGTCTPAPGPLTSSKKGQFSEVNVSGSANIAGNLTAAGLVVLTPLFDTHTPVPTHTPVYTHTPIPTSTPWNARLTPGYYPVADEDGLTVYALKTGDKYEEETGHGYIPPDVVVDGPRGGHLGVERLTDRTGFWYFCDFVDGTPWPTLQYGDGGAYVQMFGRNVDISGAHGPVKIIGDGQQYNLLQIQSYSDAVTYAHWEGSKNGTPGLHLESGSGIFNLPTPQSPADAANKQYVDAAIGPIAYTSTPNAVFTQVEDNRLAIATATHVIGLHESAIATLQAQTPVDPSELATVTAIIGQHASAIATAQTGITANTAAIATHDMRLARLEFTPTPTQTFTATNTITPVSHVNYYFTRTVPAFPGVGSYYEKCVNLGYATFTEGTGTIEIDLMSNDNGILTAKHYVIPLARNMTNGVWKKCPSVANSGWYADNYHADYVLMVNVDDDAVTFRVRNQGHVDEIPLHVNIRHYSQPDSTFSFTEDATAVDDDTKYEWLNSTMDIPGVDSSYYFRRHVSSTIGGNANDVTYLGYTRPGIDNDASFSQIYLLVEIGGFSSSKHYILNHEYGQTNDEWAKAIPVSDAGTYTAGIDYDLEVKVGAAQVDYRVRNANGSYEAKVHFVILTSWPFIAAPDTSATAVATPDRVIGKEDTVGNIFVSADYAVKNYDSEIFCDATAGGFAVTLQSAAEFRAARRLCVHKVDSSANPITVVGSINGAASYTLSKQFETANLVSNGADAYYLKSISSAFLATNYVPYTGASGAVNLGTQALTAGAGTFSGLLTQNTVSAQESAPLGSELTDGTGWTSTNWTGDYATGFAHTTGNTSALSRAVTIVTATLYQISFTVTGRTAGTFTVSLGGTSGGSFSATGAVGPRTTNNTGHLIFTPTSDFDGTISAISVKAISTSNPVQRFTDSAAASSYEIRSSLGSLQNMFLGVGCGTRNTTGIRNTGVGVSALNANTTGVRNSAFGVLTLPANTTGYDNSAMGFYSLFSNTTGYSNTAIGSFALNANTTGYSNFALGVSSLNVNTTGYQNAAIGVAALAANTTGYNNSAIGVLSLCSNTTGHSNSAIGHNSGRYIDGGGANQTGNLSVFLGNDARALANGQTNQIVIGSTAIGLGSNSAVLGNASVTLTALRGSVGIGLTAPTARLHLPAGSATASTSPLKFTSGTLLTTPEDGAIEYLSNVFYTRNDQIKAKGFIGPISANDDAFTTAYTPAEFRTQGGGEHRFYFKKANNLASYPGSYSSVLGYTGEAGDTAGYYAYQIASTYDDRFLRYRASSADATWGDWKKILMETDNISVGTIGSGDITSTGTIRANTGFSANGTAGVSGTFVDAGGKTITVTNGLITAIVDP